MGLEAALISLVITWGEMYAEQYHGQTYEDTKRVIQEYHIDDYATVGEIIYKKKITFKWEF